MKRRAFLAIPAAAAAAGFPALARAAAPVLAPVTVYKSPDCGCCGKWVEHLQGNGFRVTVHAVPSTTPYRVKAGVPVELGSCHTAFVGDYVVEGHVPAADIKRLLAARPRAKGLAVPRMPATAPGMDAPHGPAWDVLLIASDGTTRVFNSYPAL